MTTMMGHRHRLRLVCTGLPAGPADRLVLRVVLATLAGEIPTWRASQLRRRAAWPGWRLVEVSCHGR